MKNVIADWPRPRPLFTCFFLFRETLANPLAFTYCKMHVAYNQKRGQKKLYCWWSMYEHDGIKWYNFLMFFRTMS